MNILLVKCFKELSYQQFGQIIDSCYILIESDISENIQNQNIYLAATVYVPSSLIHIIFNYQSALELISKKLEIQNLHILPITQACLRYYYKQAILLNCTTAWKEYLELQYLF